MRGILNTNTGTVHEQEAVRRERGEHDYYRATCGSLKFLPEESLEIRSVEGVLRDDGVHRCGRCFENGGGY